MPRFRAWLWKGIREALKTLAGIAWSLFCVLLALDVGYALRSHLALAIATGVWCLLAIGGVGVEVPQAWQDYRDNRLGSTKAWCWYYGIRSIFWLLWPLPIAVMLLPISVLVGLVLVMAGVVVALGVIAVIPIGLMRLFGFKPKFLP